MTYNATNRKDIRAAEKLAAILERDQLEFLGAALNTTQGRLFFWHLLSDCSCFVDIPTFEPHQDYFSAGRRSIGLKLMATIISHFPDHYTTMQKEEHVRLAALAQRTRGPDGGRDDPGHAGYDSDYDNDFTAHGG